MYNEYLDLTSAFVMSVMRTDRVNLLPVDLYVCMHSTLTTPYAAFLFQIHSSRITKYPSGLQPLGDIVNMHWRRHCRQALFHLQRALLHNITVHIWMGLHEVGRREDHQVVVRGGHTQG